MNSLFDIRPKIYTTNHQLSAEMSKYLSTGFDGQMVPPVALLDGLAIMYGILRGTGDIIRVCEELNHPYLYCDHSFFNQTRSNVAHGNFSGYFRLIKNGRYFNETENKPLDRWRKLNITMKPWRKTGSKIVVAPVSAHVARLEQFDPHAWLQATVATLAKFTDRQIEIKPKDGDKPLSAVLKDAWALVTMDSNAAAEAILHGIPVITSSKNAASPVGLTDLKMIEEVITPEREQWAANLAYQQFTIEEITNGVAKEILYG